MSSGFADTGVRSRVVRLNRLNLGDFVYERPLVTVSQGTDGAYGRNGSITTDGLVGLATLARLNLTTDVAHRRLWAAPSGLATPRGRYVRTGLWIERRQDRWMVDDVGIGSPGAAAGMMAGDELVETSPAAVARLSSSVAGAAEAVTVERGGKRRNLTITPADYL